MLKDVLQKNSFLKGWIFLAFLFTLSAFLTPVAKMNAKEANTNLIIAQQDNNILVTVKSEKNTRIQLYMFSIEGQLIKEFDINGPKKFLIQKWKKGVYLYEFFSNDEHLKTGKIELK